jgi:anti-sigma regulatory factor (Ser/Thr protein kinase)
MGVVEGEQADLGQFAAGAEGHLATAAAAMAELRRHRVFPGQECQLGILRRWLRSFLLDCTVLADVLSVATELAANAVRHTRSGQGGSFEVEIIHTQKTVRVTVTDSGAAGAPRVIEDTYGETGRGLLLVSALSLETGFTGDCSGRQVWAEVPCEDPA